MTLDTVRPNMCRRSDGVLCPVRTTDQPLTRPRAVRRERQSGATAAATNEHARRERDAAGAPPRFLRPQEVLQHRANERHGVGCSDELAGSPPTPDLVCEMLPVNNDQCVPCLSTIHDVDYFANLDE
jgi:hypothetical protein